jgi:hypothetical protein
MARETAAQKKSRLSALLAEYDARNRELSKLTTIVRGLKEQLREIQPGTYGDWNLSFSTPRQILDQPKARALLTAAGVEVPMIETQPIIAVTPKV